MRDNHSLPQIVKSRLVVENIGNKKWKLVEPVSHYSRKFQKLIVARPTTITDFASVPRIFWSIFPPDGRYTKAAVIHDFLCNPAVRKLHEPNIKTRADVDFILYEAMLELGVPKINAKIMYWGVSLYRIFMRIE